MRELSELDQLIFHVCAEARFKRLVVYEPLSERWQWLTVFDCCSQIFCEPSPHEEPLHQDPSPARPLAPGQGSLSRKAPDQAVGTATQQRLCADSNAASMIWAQRSPSRNVGVGAVPVRIASTNAWTVGAVAAAR